MARTAESSTHVELVPATADEQSILSNLLELYIHDFSEFHHLDLGDDGRFGYGNLSLYWTQPDRHAFLLKVNGKLAGLVLVKKIADASGDGAIWDMAEFFVVRGWRRRGIGAQAAHEVWRGFPGQWQVRIMHSNVSARHFWAHAIREFTGEAVAPAVIEKDGQLWDLYSFASPQQ